MSTYRAPLAVTLGDANGVGPELAVRYFAEHAPDDSIVLIGPEHALEAHLPLVGGTRFWTCVESIEAVAPDSKGVYLLSPSELDGLPLNVGEPTPEGGRAAGVSLDVACGLIAGGQVSGIVTLPLHKAMLHAAGFDFPGHTEFLACAAGLGQDEACMHLCGDKLRVSLVTTHPPLREVAGLITYERVLRCLALTCGFVRRVWGDEHGHVAPVAVCGLNPHAGESGRIGREEIEIIEPAVREARARGMEVVGPLPADTVFGRAARGEFSAVLAMYHDQGLGPLKLLHFGDAVNVTLGLPFVRTSVDHGTAYDIAGRGVADMGSFRAAMRLARRMVRSREQGAAGTGRNRAEPGGTGRNRAEPGRNPNNRLYRK